MTQKFTGVYSPQVKNDKSSFSKFKILNCFLVVFVIVGSLYFVTGINDLVVKGFELQELKARVKVLSEENSKLNVEITSLKSYNNLAKRIENLKMVAVENVDYIKVNTGLAAAR